MSIWKKEVGIYNDLQINITDVQVSQNGWFFSSITRLYEQKHDKTSNSVS
jgi:hypothetical protein